MLSQYDPWFAIDPVVDETTDLLTFPELRRELAHASPAEDLGLRSLLENPDVLCKGLWSQGLERKRRDIRRHPPYPALSARSEAARSGELLRVRIQKKRPATASKDASPWARGS